MADRIKYIKVLKKDGSFEPASGYYSIGASAENVDVTVKVDKTTDDKIINYLTPDTNIEEKTLTLQSVISQLVDSKVAVEKFEIRPDMSSIAAGSIGKYLLISGHDVEGKTIYATSDLAYGDVEDTIARTISIEEGLETHIADDQNPHKVTAAQALAAVNATATNLSAEDLDSRATHNAYDMTGFYRSSNAAYIRMQSNNVAEIDLGFLVDVDIPRPKIRYKTIGAVYDWQNLVLESDLATYLKAEDLSGKALTNNLDVDTPFPTAGLYQYFQDAGLYRTVNDSISYTYFKIPWSSLGQGLLAFKENTASQSKSKMDVLIRNINNQGTWDRLVTESELTGLSVKDVAVNKTATPIPLASSTLDDDPIAAAGFYRASNPGAGTKSSQGYLRIPITDALEAELAFNRESGTKTGVEVRTIGTAATGTWEKLLTESDLNNFIKTDTSAFGPSGQTAYVIIGGADRQGGNTYAISDLRYSDLTGIPGTLSALDEQITSVETKTDNHIANISNPHKVTKVQVNLGNVDNTADKDKPVSTKQQEAINTAVNNLIKPDTNGFSSAISNKHYLLISGKDASGNAVYAQSDIDADLVESTFITSEENAQLIDEHTTDTANPHKVTAQQVGAVSVSTEAAKPVPSYPLSGGTQAEFCLVNGISDIPDTTGTTIFPCIRIPSTTNIAATPIETQLIFTTINGSSRNVDMYIRRASGDLPSGMGNISTDWDRVLTDYNTQGAVSVETGKFTLTLGSSTSTCGYRKQGNVVTVFGKLPNETMDMTNPPVYCTGLPFAPTSTLYGVTSLRNKQPFIASDNDGYFVWGDFMGTNSRIAIRGSSIDGAFYPDDSGQIKLSDLGTLFFECTYLTAT